MMSPLRFLLAFALVSVGLTGCAGPRAQTFSDPRFHPEQIATYAWSPAGNQMSGVIAQHRLVLDQAAVSAVNDGLAARGWTLVSPDDADIHVRYLVGARDRHEPTETARVRIMGREENLTVASRLLREGEMAIDLIDPETKYTFWRGAGRGAKAGVLSADRVHASVTRGVRGILDELPR